MSRRTWPSARRYALPLLAAGLPLATTGRRSGWGALALAAAVLAFFRDPRRPLPQGRGLVYAAADGLVTGVDDDVEEPWLPGARALRLSVFLSLTDVHVTRAPLAGRVVRIEELPGGFAPALFRTAEGNRRTRLLLDGPSGPVVVAQVAGALARAVTTWVREGDAVAAGERLGLIHFGSRADVLLPRGAAEPLVARGSHVRGGVTPLARLHGKRTPLTGRYGRERVCAST